ncbi:MAG TPA: hypothetical protein VL147_15300 [Devosia sp.]|nr:hypothetical protein [Devosia sp.]
MIVCGPSRAGKTDAVTQCLANLEPVTTVDGQIIEPKSDLIYSPTVFTQSALAREFLRGLGYPASRKMTADMAWSKVEDRLVPAGLTHLAIDEIEYAFKPSSVGRHSYQNEKVKIQGALSRFLDHRIWPLPLVLIGLRNIVDEYAHNDFTFMRERSDFIEIKAMVVDDRGEHGRLQRGVRTLCDVAGIGWDLHDPDYLFGRLIHAAGRARGVAIHLAKAAVSEAVTTGADHLQISHFRDVYSRKAKASVAENPFVASNWSNLDAAKLGETLDENLMGQMRKMNHAR